MGKKLTSLSKPRVVVARKVRRGTTKPFDPAAAHAAILDALPAHVALLDHRGVVVAVNAAWRGFASANDLPGSGSGVGLNYLQVCTRARGACSAEARAVAAGIRRVLRGAQPEFVLEYPCHSPAERRWFRLMATPLPLGRTTGAVVMHVNITDRRLAEEESRRLAHNLGERVKELRALHQVAELLQQDGLPTDRLLGQVAALIPPAMQYPDLAVARVGFNRMVRATSGFRGGPRLLHKDFVTVGGDRGHLEVGYRRKPPTAGPDPFLPEEQKLLDALAEMLCGHFERREAETVLRQGLTLQRIAGHVARLGGWSFDLGTRELTWSDEICAIHEVPAGHRPTLEEGINYYAPEHRTQVAAHVQACVQHGTPFDVELQILTARGRRLWVRAIGEPVRDQAGRIIRLQGALQDIAERKQAEEKTRRLAESLTTTLESITDAFFTVDPAWGFTYVNGEAERLLQRRRDELVGRNMWTEFPAAVGSLFDREYRRAVADNVTVSFEAYYPLPLDRWFEVRAYPSENGLAVYFHDITAVRQAREALRLSEERFREMADNMGDLFYNYDPVNQRLLYASSAQEKIMGYSLAEAYANPTRYLEVMHPADRPAAEHAFRRQLAGEETVVDFRVPRADGSVHWVREHAVPVKDAAGRVERIVGTMRDITERKLAAEEIRRTNETLTGIVAALQEIAGTDRPLPELMRLMAGRAQALTGADSGVVEIIEGEVMVCHAATGVAARQVGGRLPLHGTLTGLAMQSGVARVCMDTETDERVDRAACRAAGVRSLVIAPLRSGAQVIGALKVLSSRPQAFTLRDANNLQILVESLGAMIQRQQAAEHLRESEERFRKLLQSVPTVAIQGYATDGTVQYWNDASERFYGYSRDEALGANLLDLIIPPEMREGVRAALQGVAEGRDIPHSELELMRKDGSRISVFSSHAVVRSEGRPAELFCIDIDLSERKLAEQRVIEQAALLDKANDAILVRDLSHRILFWNRSAERLYGWTAAEAVGRSVQDLLYGAETAAFLRATDAVLTRGEWKGEMEQRARDGRPLTIDASWTLVRDAQGRPGSILGINTDITERKRFEQQFLRAQRMESIGTLAGGIAHDLNNLLAPIVMGAGLLQRHELPESGREILRNIERGARRSTELVRQVLSFARGVEGERIPLQLGHIVREIEDIVASTFPKSIRFEVRVPQDLWLVSGDATQLNQVLINLAVNARDAMPDGGRLTLTASNSHLDQQYAATHGTLPAGAYLVIELTDSGCGMSREVQDRIFEPFYTTKELGKGTGLGLSTVLGIVRSHGGALTVQSEPGRGSTFRIWLPAHHDQGAGTVPAAAARPAPIMGHGELVLLVDDEAPVLAITRQTLETFGYRVLGAGDGAQAVGLYALHQHEITAVLTDLMMPVMDGPMLIAALQRINPQVRLIAATGLSTSEYMNRAIALGVKHFLNKPYTAEELLTTLHQVLTAPAPTRAPA